MTVSGAALPFALDTDDGARSLLRAVVELPSPSGEEAAVAALLSAALAPYVDSAFVDEVGNVVAQAGDGPVVLTMLGHIDTVPSQLPVLEQDGVLHGRGTVDAKGSAVALAVALARAPTSVRQALSLRFIGAVEEEAPSSRGARHAVQAYARPDLLIIGEPSGWDRITMGYKGRLDLELGLRQAGAHSARDDASAAEALIEAYLALRDWVGAQEAIGSGAFDRLQLKLISVEAGPQGADDQAVAKLAFRLPPATSPAALMASLDVLLGGLAERLPLRWVFSGGESAVRGDRDGTLARCFRVAVRSVGGRPGSQVKTGTSDWNVVASHWPVDTLAYGPGDASLDHRPDERLVLAEFDRAVAVLAEVLLQLSGA